MFRYRITALDVITGELFKDYGLVHAKNFTKAIDKVVKHFGYDACDTVNSVEVEVTSVGDVISDKKLQVLDDDEDIPF